MDIRQRDNTEKGAFYIEQDEKIIAEMIYVWAGKDRFIIEHTEVSDALAGKGAGKQMLTTAVDFARRQHVKIVPVCPFAKSVFDKTPAFADVL